MATGVRLEVGALGSLDFAVEMRGAQWDRLGGSHKEGEGVWRARERSPRKSTEPAKTANRFLIRRRIIHQN